MSTTTHRPAMPPRPRLRRPRRPRPVVYATWDDTRGWRDYVSAYLHLDHEPERQEGWSRDETLSVHALWEL